MMVDESRPTEKKSDIRRGMLVPVRFFDSAIDCSVTRLLDLPKVQTEASHSLHSLYRHDYCITVLPAMHSQH